MRGFPLARPLTLVGRTGGRPALPPHLAAFIGAVVAAGLLGLLPDLLAAAAPAPVPWAALALLAALVLLSEHTAVDLGGRSRTSVTVVPVLGASFLFGAPGSLATVLAFAVCAKVKARSPVHRMLFNVGNALLAAEAARLAFHLLAPGPLGEAAPARALPAAVLAGLAYYAVNHLLLSTARGLAERRRPWLIWAADYRRLWPYYAVLGPLGLGAALGYAALGAAGLIALVAPAGLVRLAIDRHARPVTTGPASGWGSAVAYLRAHRRVLTARGAYAVPALGLLALAQAALGTVGLVAFGVAFGMVCYSAMVAAAATADGRRRNAELQSANARLEAANAGLDGTARTLLDGALRDARATRRQPERWPLDAVRAFLVAFAGGPASEPVPAR
ncbi:MAG TPA: hypothetical protein VG370_02810 [Chloroflexota bacterium]|jgi:hypothetical protein|nr:hypothetical protein [Chloroflexota bacterium]